METPANTRLNGFFVDDLEDGQNLFDVLRLWLHALMVPY